MSCEDSARFERICAMIVEADADTVILSIKDFQLIRRMCSEPTRQRDNRGSFIEWQTERGPTILRPSKDSRHVHHEVDLSRDT